MVKMLRYRNNELSQRIENEYIELPTTDFKKTKDTIKDSDLRVREFPHINAKIMGLLQKDQEVEILNRTMLKKKISDMNDYWYYIRTGDGLEGWSYGMFIELN